MKEISINQILFLSFFKRIKAVKIANSFDSFPPRYRAKNVQIICKSSFQIDSLTVWKNNLKKLAEFYKDQNVNFKVDFIKFYNDYKFELSDEAIEVLYKINPRILSFQNWKWTLENIKALTLLSWANIEVGFNKINSDFELLFSNAPIQFFDSNSDQRLSFEWESIKFYICLKYFESVILLQDSTMNYILVPWEAIK